MFLHEKLQEIKFKGMNCIFYIEFWLVALLFQNTIQKFMYEIKKHQNKHS